LKGVFNNYHIVNSKGTMSRKKFPLVVAKW
jgi:hypothetical protein